jgi:hypothetical protein
VIAKTYIIRFVFLGFFVLSILFGSTQILFAAVADDDRGDRVSVTREDVLAAIRRRAEKVLESREKTERVKGFFQFSNGIGYESNPATNGARKGDAYTEESVFGLFSKRLSPTLDWNGTYYIAYVHYFDYGDGDYASHTLTPVKLKWQPGRVLRWENWVDLDYNYYPTANDSTYRQVKFSSRLRQNMFETWFHQFQFSMFNRDYVRKLADRGDGTTTFSKRVDRRIRFRHKIGTTVKEALYLKDALLSMENSFYNNDSNDESTDHYDYQTWKTTLSVSGSITEKLSFNGSFAYERKNYAHRVAVGVDPEARYDDKYSLSGTTTYAFNPNWDASFALSFDHLGSNEPTGEYDNMKYTLSVTTKF